MAMSITKDIWSSLLGATINGSQWAEQYSAAAEAYKAATAKLEELTA